MKFNENSETINRCIFFDTETDDVPLEKGMNGFKLRFGWACATRRNAQGKWTKPKWVRFTSYDEFWLWAMHHTSGKHKTWVWCHNCAFDLPVVRAFTHLPDLGWDLESAIIDCPPTIIKYSVNRKCDLKCKPTRHTRACRERRKKAKTLVLCDTLNIWRMSLKKLGQRVGLPKLEMPPGWNDKEISDEYCKRDVDIIRKAVTTWSDFLRDNDLGGFCPTIAAQAMRTFRHRYLEDRILIENNDLSLSLARNCYHGGRCEAGFIGHLAQPVHSLDINSQYPFVMSYAEMPLRIKGCSEYVQLWQLPYFLDKYCCCAYVRLKTDEPFAAVVHEKRLCFPIGEFDTYLTSPELKYALQIKAIVEIHLLSTYEKGVPFRKFALNLYKHKEEASRSGNKVEAEHWKKLLNSFYGKWGQNGRKRLEIGACDPDRFEVLPNVNAQTGVQRFRYYFGGKVYECANDAESSESHPAIAAHITAEARMILWTLIRKMSPEDYFYCDTDGLLVSDKGLDALRDGIDQHALGKLKHVETFQDVRIHGCKDLVLDGKQKTKGIREQAERTNEGGYRQLRWFSLRGLLHTGNVDMPRAVPVTKFLRRTYTKGTVTPSGFVVPLHFPLEGSK